MLLVSTCGGVHVVSEYMWWSTSHISEYMNTYC